MHSEMRRHGTSSSILQMRHWSFFEGTFRGPNPGPHRAAADLDSRQAGMTQVTEVLASNRFIRQNRLHQ